MKSMFTAFVLMLALTSTYSPVFAQTSVDGPIIGHSEGNHRLDCTIYRPWDGAETGGPYPVIGWTNGWGQGNVFGADQVLNYDSGLYFWAETGDFIVVAANQWSPRAPDILQCLQWLLDENGDESSEYHDTVSTDQIGVSGHSQGRASGSESA